MNYDVHITRACSWLESEQKPITLQEWSAYLCSDPEMGTGHFSRLCNRSGQPGSPEPHLAVWTGWSKHSESRVAWFYHWAGCINVCNPDEEVLEKMRCIARHLGALVVGDDGKRF